MTADMAFKLEVPLAFKVGKKRVTIE
jgi:hypothetical protein